MDTLLLLGPPRAQLAVRRPRGRRPETRGCPRSTCGACRRASARGRTRTQARPGCRRYAAGGRRQPTTRGSGRPAKRPPASGSRWGAARRGPAWRPDEQARVQLKGNVSREVSGSGRDRARRMLGRDCQLMGLTWLLAKNKTAYIPTVSAMLRAMLYTAHPTESGSGSAGGAPPRCSPNQENMPLAVDSLQFEHTGSVSSAAASATPRGATAALLLGLALSLMTGWSWDAFL